MCSACPLPSSDRDCPLGTAGDRCLWHAGGTAGEHDDHSHLAASGTGSGHREGVAVPDGLGGQAVLPEVPEPGHLALGRQRVQGPRGADGSVEPALKAVLALSVVLVGLRPNVRGRVVTAQLSGDQAVPLGDGIGRLEAVGEAQLSFLLGVQWHLRMVSGPTSGTDDGRAVKRVDPRLWERRPWCHRSDRPPDWRLPEHGLARAARAGGSNSEGDQEHQGAPHRLGHKPGQRHERAPTLTVG
jgi:hypothetical protein